MRVTIRHAIAVLALVLVSMGVASAAGRILRRFTVVTGEPEVHYVPER